MEPQRTQTSARLCSDGKHYQYFTHKYNYSSHTRGLAASVVGFRHVVKGEQSCEENTDAQGSDADREQTVW